MGPFFKKENCEINTESPQGVSARITVVTRESGDTDSFGVWEFFLNGENIGTLEGRGRLKAAAAVGQKNVLTAKDNKDNFTPPYEFYTQSGEELEVRFDGGRFGEARTRHMPGEAPEDPAGQEAAAQVTVKRRENSGINSFEKWDFFLNGESIGRIDDGSSVTARTNERNNVLEAKSAKEAETELRFIARGGSQAEVTFRGGQFTDAQGMDVVLPEGDPKGFEKITKGFISKRWGWMYWAVLALYYAGVFVLFRGQIIPAFALGLLPVLAAVMTIKYAYGEMVDYLSLNHSEAWGRIARDRIANEFWRGDSILSYDREVSDPGYGELRELYWRARLACGLSAAAYIAACVYAAVTSVHR